jgi:hypothetical protein
MLAASCWLLAADAHQPAVKRPTLEVLAVVGHTPRPAARPRLYQAATKAHFRYD